MLKYLFLLVLCFSLVSANQFTITYNFNDTTNQKAFWASPAGRSIFATGTEATAPQYLNISANNLSFARALSDNKDDEPFWRLNFTIPTPKANLSFVNISVRGLKNADTETATAYVYNVTGNALLSMGTLGATDTNISMNFTTQGAIGDIINSGNQLMVYIECANCDSGEYIQLAYAEAYTLVLNNTVTDSCTYPGSGNWNVDFAHNCSVTTNVNLGGNNLSVNGSGGQFILNGGNITNFKNIYFAGTVGVKSFVGEYLRGHFF